ncbi:pleckstrin y domain containing, M (with RUN domain) member 2, partial [Homalodisca vitripennis]
MCGQKSPPFPSYSPLYPPLKEYSRNQPCEQSGGQEFGTSLNTVVSTSSDNTLADNTTVDNTTADRHNANTDEPDNKAKGIIQPSSGGVCRRRKKKKSEPGKRVSFHQDSNDDSDAPVILREPRNLNKFYVEGRYSWGGEGDTFFIKEQENFRQVKSEIYERKGLSSSINIFESELGIEADCDSSTTTLDDAKLNIETVCEKLTSVVRQSLGLGRPQLAEREAPEGQEDPARSAREYERLLRNTSAVRSSVDLTSDSEWSMDTPDRQGKRYLRQPGPQRNMVGQPNWHARMLHEAPSKTSLVKRFLRSIPTRKPYKEKKPSIKRSLYIPGVKPDSGLTEKLLGELELELRRGQVVHSDVEGEEDAEDETVTAVMEAALVDSVFMDKQERIYKVYRVASTEGEPLLAVLTDMALYMTGLGLDQQYIRRHHICYHTLDTIVIGPEYQTVMLVTVDHSVTVTVISALGRALVTHMVTHLALAVYRRARSHLSVCQLSLSTMQSLYRALLAHTSVSSDEQLHYYRYIRVEDSYIAGPCGPLGPSKCGHLMYRPHNHSPWLPGYIVLRGGVLYVFSDVHQLTPRHVLSFHRGYFGGCRRVFNANRPHTFEVLPFSQSGLYGTFQFAAADDYESSDWLQAFIQTSATMSQSPTSEEPVVGCGLLLTTRHLLTLDFPDTVLSCIRLQDISIIRTATTCCVLETTCREVQQSGGDWILYFLTQQAISEFLDSLYTLRPQLKQ